MPVGNCCTLSAARATVTQDVTAMCVWQHFYVRGNTTISAT